MRSLPSQSEPLLQPDGRARIPWYGWFDELWRKLRGLWSVDDGKILFMDGTTIGGATVGSGLTLNRTTNTLSANAGDGFPEAPQDGTVYGRQNAAWAPAGGRPADPNTSVQWNNGGVFGGSGNLLWTNSNSRLVITGDAQFVGDDRFIYINAASSGVVTGRLSFKAGTTDSAAIANFVPSGTSTTSGLAFADNSALATNTGFLSFSQLGTYCAISTNLQTGASQRPFYMQQSLTGANARTGFIHYPTNNFNFGDWSAPGGEPVDPGYKVQIDGTLNLTGALYLNGSSGNSGYVLTSQGAGDPIWAAASSAPADGDKGDITVSGSGLTWTIDAGVVTYAKMQDVSAASLLLGRGSAAGSGDVQEISIGTGLTLSGTTLSVTNAVTFGQLLVDDTSGGSILFDDSGDVLYENAT